ncbi:uncharacterized protein LOC115890385 [Sitophilus oryzae]|uniref:Uncharacterized protein LOC115890385 n=1 Tax=Sitophilus oryzae TaxID=7048 RepID=A0A6J2YT56_SITOR|nr:uncharacterized protein LOC115890385 [Sitophilus oryzae]XP_030766461.1 uncharacterized protein LOC115890385 [Sitophilus oryzae]XP_030766462.1 uncharacterized protein LOC115890385 [Sitophilus oryzae]XP_030766463.1 uncharacterized protein LOC115890385 [Sitophilus oryzae]XP_030766464.1 uncharacterized protein LOC115890385 [Sitophilus oryzae]
MRRPLKLFLWLVLVNLSTVTAEEGLDITKVDIAQLATHAYGTELIFLENAHYTEHQSYKFEDFFWTGSGDGATEDNIWVSESPGVIYKTSTVVSTVFVETSKTPYNESTTPKALCTNDCDIPEPPSNEINPTPTQNEGNDGKSGRNHDHDGSDDDFLDAGRQFWLVTVLRSDGKDPAIVDLKNSLAKLYKVAFQRQQDQHLGLAPNRQKRAPIDQPVNVHIHKIDKQKLNGDDKIEVLYHVEVLGKPVDAYTAANDMKLVTDDEVQKALGYPFLIKAEPYLKASEPMSLSGARNTWFVIGASIMGILLLLLVLAFLILGFAKRNVTSPKTSALGIDNRRHIFERGVGPENKGLVQDGDSITQERNKDSPTYINFDNQHTNAGLVLRVASSASVTSSSSSSLDISPLMSLSKKRKTPRKPTRPRAALNKTVPLNMSMRKFPPEVFDSDSGTSRKDESPDFEENMDPGVMSPKSYLSMPSVRSFPRTNMPEPLAKVLEPVSVTHLDMPNDEVEYSNERRYGSEYMVRHGSVGTVEDPGVIGPAVWNMHCERLKHGVSVDQGISDLKDGQTNGNIARMRKRFHDLLDDTFSLFGSSRKGSPVKLTAENRSTSINIEVKSHSAIETRPDEPESNPIIRPRPKTTGAKNPEPHSSGPSCAWSSTAPSPLIRPVSAAPILPSAASSNASSRVPTAPGIDSGLRRMSSGALGSSENLPRVNVDHVLAEGRFRPSDPAISVIEAIKSEIERVSLPGSTTDLNR